MATSGHFGRELQQALPRWAEPLWANTLRFFFSCIAGLVRDIVGQQLEKDEIEIKIPRPKPNKQETETKNKQHKTTNKTRNNHTQTKHQAW